MDQALVRQVLAAVQQGDKKTLQEVIAKGKVGVVDEEETTPLMYAAASGREEVLRILLDKEVHILWYLYVRTVKNGEQQFDMEGG